MKHKAIGIQSLGVCSVISTVCGKWVDPEEATTVVDDAYCKKCISEKENENGKHDGVHD